MSIKVVRKGLLTTVQDLGRIGLGRYGINPNGAMDRRMVRVLNILLGNQENQAVLEMCFPAPILEFNVDSLIALGGADFGPMLDEHPVGVGRSIFIRKGGRLEFRQNRSGNFCYLAVAGGIEADLWMESASTNLTAGIGGFRGRALQTGDEIRLGQSNIRSGVGSEFRISNSFFPGSEKTQTNIRVIAGPEYDFLTGLSEEILFGENFEITSESNRMGYRLAGKPLFLLEDIEMISSAVSFGTMQLLPDGQMIVLMADHQTTGGYPRIANVISTDLPVLAQLGPHDKIRFVPVSYGDAERLLETSERDLSLFRTGCRFAISDS